MTPRQPAATDPSQAAAPQLPELLKPALDQIDASLDQILAQITALKQTTAARCQAAPPPAPRTAITQ